MDGIDASPIDVTRESSPASKLRGLPRLESLPPEVRRHLLSVLDLPLLKALVRASPTFHQQYLYDRKYILRRSIKNTFGSAELSVCVLDQAPVMRRDRAAFLNWYSEQTSGQRTRQLTEDQAQDITAYYFRFVKPVSESYSRVILDDLFGE